MPSAKLIKALEREGFFLEFPGYSSKEGLIAEILKEDNPRIRISLPLFLMEPIDYKGTTSKINAAQKKEFNKAIIISEKIYKAEGIENDLKRLIKENKLKASFSKQEFEEYYNSFKR